MGYQSKIILFQESKSIDIIEFIDSLLNDKWILGVDHKIIMPNPVQEFEYEIFNYSLTNIIRFYNIAKSKNEKKEFFRTDFTHFVSQKKIEVIFDFSPKNVIQIILLDEEKEKQLVDPIGSINSYLKVLYASLVKYSGFSRIQYFSGYNSELLKDTSFHDLELN